MADFNDDTEVDQMLHELAEAESEDFDDLKADFEPNKHGDGYKVANWVIYETEDAAEAVALAQVQEDLENEPGLFNQDWLSSFIDEENSEIFFRQVYEEWDSSYVSDIDKNRLEEEMADAGVDSEEAYVEYLVNSKIEEGEGGLSHYRDNFGEEAAAKLISDNNLLDLDAAAESAISTDGWAHFISHYDGNYETLPCGAVYFRES